MLSDDFFFAIILEGIYLPSTFGVHTLRESDTARLICVYYSIVIPYGLQWFKRYVTYQKGLIDIAINVTKCVRVNGITNGPCNTL